jgi:hypothetical protein
MSLATTADAAPDLEGSGDALVQHIPTRVAGTIATAAVLTARFEPIAAGPFTLDLISS